MPEKNGNQSKKNTDYIKVTVACNYPLLVEGLSKILEEDKNIEIVAKAYNLLDLVQFCEEHKFDILLLDVDLKGLNLNKVLQLLKKYKGVKVVLIIDNEYDEYTLISSLRSGVRGYILKETDSKHVTKAIKSVYDGELWVERKMMVKVLDSFLAPLKGQKGKGEINTIYNLTEAETKIVKLVLTGLSNKDIARDIYLSEKTVKFHLYKIFKKLSVKNRSELILYGFKKGFIS
jgi:DNA-binding NarL/FixJ family response regulator